MVLVLKSDKDIKKVKKFLTDRKNKKNFDAKEFCGILKFEENGLAIQQKLRDEWN